MYWKLLSNSGVEGLKKETVIEGVNLIKILYMYV
jgi:hypothetical protein